MDNQHKKITGYRDLTKEEIDLMNEIKAKGAELQALVGKVRSHIAKQAREVGNQIATCTLEQAPAIRDEEQRIALAEPGRWASIGSTSFQTGLMALTRAVAQPTSY